MELTKPDRREELIADLEARTGLKITSVKIGGIDFLRDTVVLRIGYLSTKESDEVDGIFTIKKSQWRESYPGTNIKGNQ